MKLYHNPRCSKSREALELLKAEGHSPELVLYMAEPLLPDELQDLLSKLQLYPQDLIRTNESTWKEEFEGKELMDEELILAMIEYPELMQRPILEVADKAIIARPAEKIKEVI